METPQHQEWHARQAMNWKAVAQTALFAGGITFIMSGGSPWTTAGTMNAIVGRDLPWALPVVLLAHFIAAFLYATIIALAVYRCTLIPAVILGGTIGVALSLLSREVFSTLGWIMQSPEIRATLTHLVFGLFAAAVYKGASVRPPLKDDSETHHHPALPHLR